MNVKEIVAQYLNSNGYDGLCCSKIECGCTVNALFPCGNTDSDCVAGHLVACGECPEYKSCAFRADYEATSCMKGGIK